MNQEIPRKTKTIKGEDSLLLAHTFAETRSTPSMDPALTGSQAIAMSTAFPGASFKQKATNQT